MGLQEGDTLTKADGEIYSVETVMQSRPNDFTAGLLWTNPPPPPLNVQQPYHVFAPGCLPLKTLDVTARWDAAPLEANDTPWRFVFRAWSPLDQMLLELDYCTMGGTNPPITGQRCYVDGVLVQSEKIVLPPIGDDGSPIPPKIQPNEWVDFYSDGDSGQMFRYGPGAAFQRFSENFQTFPGSPQFTEVAVSIEPAVPGTALQFTALSTSVTSLGQIVNNTENGDPISVSFLQEPAPSMCGLGSWSPPSTNVLFSGGALYLNPLFAGTPTGITAKILMGS